MNLDVMLEKINTVVDNRIKAENDKDTLEKELLTKYADIIDSMSERISNVLTIVNVLTERKIPKTQYTYQLYHDFCEVLKEKGIKVQFLSSGKNYLDPPYTYVCSIIEKDMDSLSPNVYWTQVDKYGSPQCYQKWRSGGRSTISVKSKFLLNFINEFEKAEQALQEYIESLS